MSLSEFGDISSYPRDIPPTFVCDIPPTFYRKVCDIPPTHIQVSFLVLKIQVVRNRRAVNRVDNPPHRKIGRHKRSERL